MLDVNKEIKQYLFNEFQAHNFELANIATETGLHTSVCLQAVNVDSDEIITADTFTKFQEYFDNHAN